MYYALVTHLPGLQYLVDWCGIIDKIYAKMEN